MKNIVCLLLLGLWSCAPKIAKTVETKKGTAVVEEEPVNIPNPPISIDGGTQIKKLYVGMPNEIKVNIEGGNTKHLIVGATSGTIKPVDVSKGIYTFSANSSGMAVEIYAKDTINKVAIAEIYDVVPFPAPNAFVWTHGKKWSVGNIPEMDAATFRMQDVLYFYYSYRVPVRCVATAFKMVRITSDGKVTSHLNEDELGKFDEQTKAMVQQARTGDIYVIKDIKTTCTSKPVKDIVYTF